VRLLCLFAAIAVAYGQPGGYTISTFAGSSVLVEGGAAVAAIFSQNEGLAVDSQGNVYVSDAGDNHVRKITPDGAIRTVASTGLNQPYGLALDSAGSLYIADLGNQCVRRVNSDGTLSMVVAQGLSAPRNLAFDLDGSLLISDFGSSQVFRYSSAGILSVVAGTGTPGFSGDNGPAASAQLNAPAALTVDSSGALYIADSGNNRIRKIVGGNITTVMSIGSPVGLAALSGTVYVAAANYLGTLATALGTFSGVQAVASDSAGNLYYITSTQVIKVGAQGLLTVVAGSGANPGYGGDGGPPDAARLNGPSALALDTLGNLYIADTLNNRVRLVSTLGMIETLLDSSTLSEPAGLILDGQNNLYIADTGNHRVLELTSGGVATTIVDGLTAPGALAMDSGGALYIADTNRVLRVAGTVVSTAVTVNQPVGLAFDSDGALLIATPTGVLKMTTESVLVSLPAESAPATRGLAVTASGGYLTTSGNQVSFNGTPIAGGMTGGFGGDGGLASAALLAGPSGMVVDSHGLIYVADSGNNRIRLLTPPPVAPLTVVNAASMVAGPIAANEIVSLFGSNFPAAPAVLIGGASCQVFYAGTTQINALVPAGVTGTVLSVQVAGAAASVPLALVAPGLFASALNQDGTINGAGGAAARESVVTFYATGLGADLSSLTVTIGGYLAAIQYAGAAPGFAGLEQLNILVPGGFAPSGVLAVVLTVGGAQARGSLTVQ
jgi:uncharacterized protein (TIGR03437 family)